MTIPRTCQLDLATPPEVALREALRAVEAMPADVRLTHAGQKIVEALDLVGDYVNDQLHAGKVYLWPRETYFCGEDTPNEPTPSDCR